MPERDDPKDPMTFESFRRSFHYGDHADMQFKFLAKLSDEAAGDALARVLAALGEAVDTGDLGPVRDAVYAAQVEAYAGADSPTVPDAPFTPVDQDLPSLRLALISAGGVFRVGDDPMGLDGPTQEEAPALIKDFLRRDTGPLPHPEGHAGLGADRASPGLRRADRAARPGHGLPAGCASRPGT